MKSYQIDKEINGKKYKAQFSGLGAWLKCVDESYIDGTSTVSNVSLAANTLKFGLVEPAGLTIDDFESLDELTAVTSFVSDVMKGNFRDKASAK